MWIIGAVVSATTLIAGCGKSSDTTSDKPGASGPVVDAVPSDIGIAYHDNSLTADERFKGKALRITGRIDDIGQDASGSPLLRLHDYEGPALYADVLCAWGGDRASAAHLPRYVRVVIDGVGDGATDGKPLVIGCKLDRPIVDPTKQSGSQS